MPHKAMEKPGKKPHSRKYIGPFKQVASPPEPFDFQGRLAAVDDAMQRLRKRLDNMESELLDLQAFLQAEEDAKSSKSG